MSKLSWWKTICLVCVFCATATIGLPAETFTTLRSFDGTDGSFPGGSLVQGLNGNFNGTLGGPMAMARSSKSPPRGKLEPSFSADSGSEQQPSTAVRGERPSTINQSRRFAAAAVAQRRT